MTTNWKGGDGDWQTAANWTNGAPTTPSAFAVIAAAGTYTVTIGSGLEYHVGAISLNAAGAKLAIAGILDLTNKLTVSKGTLALSGTINGGTIVAGGGMVRLQNATLDSVTYDGTLDLASTQNTVTVKDGLTLHGAGGTGAGTIKLGGSSKIDFVGSQTLNGGTLAINGGTLLADTLTIGASATVLCTGQLSVQSGVNQLTNLGKITVGKGTTLGAQQWLNHGTVAVNGGQLSTIKFTNFANGTVKLAAGTNFSILNSNTSAISSGFYNQGTLIANKATLNLYKDNGDFGKLKVTNSVLDLSIISTLSALDTVTNMLAGGNNRLSVTFITDNTGSTLHLGLPSGFASFAYDVGVQGGTVSIDAPFSGSLSAVSYQGTADVVGSLTLDNVVFSGTGGVGSATINLDGSLAGSFDDATVIATNNSTITPYFIGTNATIQALGNLSIGHVKLQFQNAGTIDADGAAGSKVFLHGEYFNNTGTIRVENGGQVRIRGLSNVSGDTLTRGTYDVGAHSSIAVAFEGKFTPLSIKTLQATVALEGAGAAFLDSGLATIGAQGVLSLENGATLSVAANFRIDGTLDLSGSDFKSAHLTLDTGGTLAGHGSVLGAVANSGLLDADGGTLSISQGVTGTGQSKIEAGATLEFGSDASAGQTVTFESATGTLALGNAGGFAGTIVGFAQGDTIDLINTKAGSVVYHAANDTLSVKFQGKIIATLQLSGDYSGDTYGVASDGNGGTAITLTGAAPGALQRFTEARAAFSSSDMAATGAHAIADTNCLAAPLAPGPASHIH